MYELITEATLPEYEAFVQSHPKGNFAQSSLWAKQKPMWQWDAIAVRGTDGKICGTMALMTRKVPGIGKTLMYGCRDVYKRQAMPLAEQLVHQRSVHPGPLVLRTAPFKLSLIHI